MAKKVYIDVVVDDKGTTKKVAVNAKALGKSLKETSKGAHSADRALKGAAKTSSSGTKNFSKMSQGITGGLVPAYATLAANVFAISAAFQFFKKAADLKALEAAQASYAATTGTNLQAITKQLQSASGGMLQFEKAASTAAIGAAKGFSTADLESLVVGARKASAALGRSFEDSMDRLVRGVSKAEPELLDELGIILRLKEATEDYAESIGSSADELTTYQRGQAVLVKVQEELTKNFGNIDISTTENAFTKLAKTFDDIVKVVSQSILPIFESFANIINRSTGSAIAVFGAVGLSIAKSALPLDSAKAKIKGWGDAVDARADRAAEKFRAAKAELDNLNVSLDDVQMEGAGGVSDSAEKFLDKGSTSKTLKKAKKDPFSLNKRDEANLKKAFKSAEKQYKKFGKIKTGIFQHGTIEEVRAMKSSLKEMTRTSVGFHNKQRAVWGKTGAWINKTWQKSKQGGMGMVKGIGSAVGGMGKLFSKALGAAGAVGAVFFLIDTFKELRNNIYDIISKALGWIDDLINYLATTDIGKSFLKGFNTVLDWLATFIQKFIGLYTGLMKALGGGAQLMGFDNVSKSYYKAADATTEWVDGLAEGIRNIGGTAAGAAEGTKSNFREQWQESDMGKAAKKTQKEGRDSTAAEKALKDAQDRAKEVREALEKNNKSYQDFLGKVDKGEAQALGALENLLRKQRAIHTTEASTIFKAFVDETKDAEGQAVLKSKQLTTEQLEHLTGIMAGLNEASGGAFADFAVVSEETLPSVIAELLKLEKQAKTTTGTYGGLVEASKVYKRTWREGVQSGDLSALKALESQLEQINKDVVALSEEAGGDKEILEGVINAFKDLNSQESADALTNIRTLITEIERLDAVDKALTERQGKVSLLSSSFGAQESAQIALERAQAAVERNRAAVVAQQSTQQGLDVKSPEYKAAQNAIDELNKALPGLNAKLVETAANTDEIGKIGRAVGETLTNSLSEAFQGLIQGTVTAKEAFANMAKSILGMIAQMITKLMVMKLLQSTLGMTGFGAWLGIPAGKDGGILSPPEARYGGVIKEYTTGGIARGRNTGYPAVLHGTEAVVPLPNGKSIPVDMPGGGQVNNVNITVAMNNQGQAQQNTQGDGEQGRQLGRAISNAVQEELQRQKRPGGILSPYGAA